MKTAIQALNAQIAESFPNADHHSRDRRIGSFSPWQNGIQIRIGNGEH